MPPAAAAPLVRRLCSASGSAFSSASANRRPSTPAGVRGQRQRAGERPQAGRHQQHRGPHQFGDRAQHIEHGARGGARRAAPKRPGAGSASGRPASTASSVPRADMASVSRVATSVLARKAGASLGRREAGQEFGRWSTASAREELAPIAAAARRSWRRPAPAGRQQAARCRPARRRGGDAACGVASASSEPPAQQFRDQVGAAPPAARTRSAWWPLRRRPSSCVDSSMRWPRPPAPTKPITAEPRIAHSQR